MKNFEEIKDFSKMMSEEIAYHENIKGTRKSLEATLWGLEEQLRFPENAGQKDQEELSQAIEGIRLKLINCDKLLESHLVRLNSAITSLGGCGGSCG